MATDAVAVRRGFGAWFLALIFSIFLGTAFIIASLPKGARSLSARPGWHWLAEPAKWSMALGRVLPPMPILLMGISYVLAGYLGALLLISLRHLRLDLFGIGILVTAVAAVVIHIFAWVGVTVYRIAAIMLRVFLAVMGFLLGLAQGALGFLKGAARAVFVDSLGVWGWAAVAAAALVGLALAFRFGPKRLKEVVKIAAAMVAAVLALGVLVAAFVLVILGLKALFSLVPASVWATIRQVLGILVAAGVIGLILATVGQLFWDQLRSTKHAGSERRGVAMGATAVGSTLALLMLGGNIYNAYAWYPKVIAEWARDVLLAKNDPQFDAVVTIGVIGLSVIGVLTNLVRLRPGPDMAEFGRSLVYGVFGFVVAGSILALGRHTE